MTATSGYPRVRGGIATRLVTLLAGLVVCALGVVLTIRSDLGLGRWDVLHDGLSDHTPLSFGTALVLVGVVVLLAAVALGVRPGPGTFLNAALVGVLVDLLDRLLPGAEGAGPATRVALDVAGVAGMGAGTAVYLSAGLGAGPRDSLMLGITGHLRVRVGIARTLLELSALGVGVALGGRWGIGTVVFAFGVGPAMELAFWLLARSPVALRGADAAVRMRPGRLERPTSASAGQRSIR